MFAALFAVDGNQLRKLPEHGEERILVRQFNAQQCRIVLERQSGVTIRVAEQMERVRLEPVLQILGDRQQSVRFEPECTIAELGNIRGVARFEKSPRVQRKREVDAALLEAEKEVVE